MMPSNDVKKPFPWVEPLAIALALAFIFVLFGAWMRSAEQTTNDLIQGVGIVFSGGERVTGSVIRPYPCAEGTYGALSPSGCSTSFGSFDTDHDLLIVRTRADIEDDGDWSGPVVLRDSQGRALTAANTDMSYSLVGSHGEAPSDRQALVLGQSLLRDGATTQSNRNDHVFFAWPWERRAEALFRSVLQHDTEKHTWRWIIEHQERFRSELRDDLQRAANAVEIPGGLHPNVTNVLFSLENSVPDDLQAQVNADAEAASAVIRARALAQAAKRQGIALSAVEKAAPVVKRPLVRGMDGSSD